MSVELEHLTKHYSSGGQAAVDDVTLNAPTGGITALLGPSGAGKSTILRLIAGLEQPDDGQIRIEGVDSLAVPIQRRGVGFVFQNYALFDHMTVRDNIGFGLSVRRVAKPQITQRVDELLELVQLKELARRYPAQLSGGQRQRVAFARSLAPRPKVLLLDEPFGALDAQVRVELRDWLQQFHEKTQLTTILVTHDQTEALDVAHHIAVLKDGRLVQAGPPQEVYDHPATPFVAAFLGGASVVRGHVREGRAELGQLGVVVVPTASRAHEGQSVQAFVRPQDVRIEKVSDNDPAIALGRIERLRRVGGHMKLALTLPTGETVTVEMPAHEFDALNVSQGDRVFVDIRAAKVFVGDYAI